MADNDRTLEIKITADDKELKKSLDSAEKAINSFAKKSAGGSVELDTATVEKKIKEVSSRLKEIAENKTTKFNFDYGDSLKKINAVLEKLSELNKPVTIKAQERSLRTEARSFADRAEKAWKAGDVPAFNQYKDSFALAMKDLVDFKKALGDLSVSGEKGIYSNMARSLSKTSPLYDDLIKKVKDLNKEQKAFNDIVSMPAPSKSKSTEKSLRQEVTDRAKLAETAWKIGGIGAFAQYKAQFFEAMQNLSNFKKELGNLSSGGEKSVYINMARSLQQTSPLYDALIKKAAELDLKQKQLNADIKKAATETISPKVDTKRAKAEYVSLARLARETALEAEKAWRNVETRDIKFPDLKSQFTDITNTISRFRKDLGTLTLGQEIKNYESMLRGLSPANPLLAEVKTKLEELYKEKAELDKIKNDIKGKLAATDKATIVAKPDVNKVMRALQANVVARANDYNTAPAERTKRAYEGALEALVKFKQQQQGMLSFSGQKALYNSVAPQIQKDSKAYELLRQKIREVTNATKQLNSEEKKASIFGNKAEIGNYITASVGRASKGWGSFLEVISFTMTRLSGLSGNVGKFFSALSISLGITTLAAGVWVGAFQLCISVLQQFGQLLLTALRPGYEVFAQSTKGVLSLSAALRTMGNVQGQLVSKAQATAASVNLMNQALYRAQQSAFSYQEIIQGLQGVLPLVLGKGMNAQQALDITTGVAGVAKLTGLHQSQILQETRDLMQGTITARTSQVANALGITNDDLAQYKNNSDELFKYLMGKFQAYSDVLKEYSNTVPGSIEQLQETVGIAGQTIIDAFGADIVGIVKQLTNALVEFSDINGTVIDTNNMIVSSTKTYTDALGNQQSVVGLIIDENQNLVDSLGNVVVAAQEVSEQGLGFDIETTQAQLTEPMQQILIMLEDVANHVLIVALSFKEWLVANDYIEDTGDSITDVGEVLKIMITFVAESIEWWIKFADYLHKIYLLTLRPFYLMLKDIAYLLKTIITSTAKLTTGDIFGAKKDWENFKNTFVEDMGKLGADIASSFDGALSYLSIDGKDYSKKVYSYFNRNAKEQASQFKFKYLRSFGDYKSLSDYYKLANDKGFRPSDVSGNIKSASDKDTAKAQREALRAATKAYEAQKEVLKNSLEDIKIMISKQLDSLDTMFEQGLMTAEEYYTKKTELESQQAQADVDYYNKLIELTNKRPYEYEEDRQKELLKLNREWAKAAAKLEDIHATQRELVKLTKESSEIALEVNQMTNAGKAVSKELIPQQLSSYSNYSGKFAGLSQSDLAFMVAKAVEYGVDARLVAAMIAVESGGNQGAISDAGAIGVGQLMPATARELGVDPYDKLQNIEGTIKYIAQLLQQFNGDAQLAVAAYNAGAGAVQAYGGIPPYAETQNHVNKVMSVYQGMSDFGVIDTRVVEYGNTAQNQLNGYITQSGESNYLEGGFDSRYISKWESEPGATDLYNVKDFVVSAFNMAANEYMAASGQQGKLVITGGAEKGYHAQGEYSHEKGYKLDVSDKSIANLQLFLDIFSKYGFAIGDERNTGHFDLSAAGAGTGGTRLATPTTPLISRTSSTVVKNYSDVAQKNALKMKQAFEKQQEEMLSIIQEWNKLFSGGYEAERRAVINKYNKQIHEYEEKIKGATEKNLQDELSQVKQRLIDIRDYKLTQLDYTEIKENLNYQFEDLNRSIQTLSAKLASGVGDIAHDIVVGAQAVAKYYNNYFGTDSPINAELNKLIEETALAQKQGSIGDYWERQKTIDSIFKTYANNIETALDKIDESYKHRIQMLDYSDMSPLQIEERKSIIQSLEAQSKVDIYTQQLNGYIQKRNEFQEKIDELVLSDKEDKEQLIAVYQTLVDKINSDYIPSVQRAIELNTKLAHIPTLLEKVRKTAKESLEDGLVTFLTDGVNECENLGEAFRNLVIGILKDLQKLFAKELVTNLMDLWFGKKKDAADVETLGTRAKPYDDESYIIRSMDYNAWYRQQNPYRVPLYDNPMAGISWQTKSKDWLEQDQTNKQFDFSLSQLNGQFGYVNQNLSQFNSALQQSTQAFNMNSSSVDKDSKQQDIDVDIPFSQTLSQASTTMNSELIPAINNASSALSRLSASSSSSITPSAHASGGYISGAGTSTSDSIPALLSNGEFVIKASSVKKYGLNFLNAVNSGVFSRIKTPKFATGGYVNSSIEDTARGMASFSRDIGTNISTTNRINLALVRNEDEAMEHFMRSGAGQRAMLDFTRKNASYIGKVTKGY